MSSKELWTTTADFVDPLHLDGATRVKNPEKWLGYLRSALPIDNQRRHHAKCKGCHTVLADNLMNMTAHRLSCPIAKDERTGDANTTEDNMYDKFPTDEIEHHSVGGTSNYEFIDVSSLPEKRLKNPEKWSGFLRSTYPADAQRRYRAKCIGCGTELTGIAPAMDQHRRRCLYMKYDDASTSEAQDEVQDSSYIIEEPKEDNTSGPSRALKRKRASPAEVYVKEPEEESSTNPSKDTFSRKVLRRIMRINMDHAELRNQLNTENAEIHNQLLQQQHENDNIKATLAELKRAVHQLQRSAQQAHQGSPLVTVEEDDVDIPKFPLYRMQQMDDLEERILNEPVFKRKLERLFKSGQMDKVDSILTWFSAEILAQFTCKSDTESLATHQCTKLSVVFKLIYSAWSGSGFTAKDFQLVVKEALDVAASQLALAAQDRNKRRAKLAAEAEQEEAIYESDEDIQEMEEHANY